MCKKKPPTVITVFLLLFYSYTKTVVDVGLNAQKYNPEIKPNSDIQNVDSRIANLVDKLRHVHHVSVFLARRKLFKYSLFIQ